MQLWCHLQFFLTGQQVKYQQERLVFCCTHWLKAVLGGLVTSVTDVMLATRGNFLLASYKRQRLRQLCSWSAGYFCSSLPYRCLLKTETGVPGELILKVYGIEQSAAELVKNAISRASLLSGARSLHLQVHQRTPKPAGPPLGNASVCSSGEREI